MPNQIKEHTVFVGNIPYGLTEEQIVHILSQAGSVLNFRLVTDKDTGRPRGYGFAEFSDHDAAASATRNLNGHEVMGRNLRVDWSNDGPSKDEPKHSGGSGGGDMPNVNGASATQNNLLPTLPPGTDLPPGISCPDQISKTLNAIPPPQLLDMLSAMKSMDPQQVTQLLSQAPQLSYAIFQALLLLGLVDTSVLGQVVTQAQQSQQQPPLPMQNPPAPPPQMPHLQQPHYSQMPTATPPVQAQPQFAPPPTAAASNDPQAALRQIISMSPEQVDAYDPATRAQLMAVRQQYGMR